MGWKDWVYGDLVSAADFQSLVQDQTVQRYADSATRSSTLGSAVAEGMVSYLDSTNQVEVYDGSSWASVSSSGSGNAIINGAFDIWQRGTSFSNPADSAYLADRFVINYDGTGATRTISQQAFTPGAAPVAGYESAYFMRHNQSVAGSGGTYQVIGQKIEDARTFAGQTATFSFWAKADAARTLTLQFHRNYGTGGSSTDFNILASAPSFSVTTSWTRFTATVSIPSVSGETIGTSSFLWMILNLPLNVVQTIDLWGVQLEAGSSATPFKRNAPSLQGELAACQRYCVVYGGSKIYERLGIGSADSSTSMRIMTTFPVRMRATPTLSVASVLDWQAVLPGVVGVQTTSITLSSDESSPLVAAMTVGFGSNGNFGSSKSGVVAGNGTTNAQAIFSAEL